MVEAIVNGRQGCAEGVVSGGVGEVEEAECLTGTGRAGNVVVAAALSPLTCEMAKWTATI
jgi:hypothetical protein